MVLLDLQGMENAPQNGGGGGGGSSASAHSCPSNFSILFCDGTSALSITLCHE
jgi:hypothetical protein